MTFDPSEARDSAGKWTAGAASGEHEAGPSMHVEHVENAAKADAVARAAAAVCEKLGFDPKLITVSDESKTFQLNGKELFYAGAAFFPPPKGDGTTEVRGTIALYTPHLTESSVAGVTAHEIEHQKFQAFVNDHEDERTRMRQDPDYAKEDKWVPGPGPGESRVTNYAGEPIHREFGFMRADGTLNEPYASRYPAYQAYEQAVHAVGIDHFAKNDGVTGYSREYWYQFQNQRGLGNAMKAYHETLAEMARLKYEGQPVNHYRPTKDSEGKTVYMATGMKRSDPKWNALYRAVDANWKRRSRA